MKVMLRLLPAAALLGLPVLAAGYAFTTVASDGTIQQNRSTGQAVIWNVPQQSIAFNFNARGPDFNASAQAAMNEWNAVNTPLQYQPGTNGAPTCGADSYNSAGWGTVTCSGQPFGDALAVTKRSFTKIGDSWYLNEADIALDQSRNWQIYSGNLSQSAQDFHRVILHELGHALGLDHPDDAGQTVAAIMNSRTSNIDSLQTDDKNGIGRLYSGRAASSSAAPASGGGADPAMALLVLLALFARYAPRCRFMRRGRPVTAVLPDEC